MHQSSDRGCGYCQSKQPPQGTAKTPLQYRRTVQTWMPLVYLQSFSWKTQLLGQAQATRNEIITIWDDYAKGTAQSIMNLLYATFRRWSSVQVNKLADLI